MGDRAESPYRQSEFVDRRAEFERAAFEAAAQGRDLANRRASSQRFWNALEQLGAKLVGVVALCVFLVAVLLGLCAVFSLVQNR